MPQTPRKENVSGRESLVASDSVERLNKTKTRNQLLDLASLKLLRCSFRKWWVLLEWIQERMGNKAMMAMKAMMLGLNYNS